MTKSQYDEKYVELKKENLCTDISLLKIGDFVHSKYETSGSHLLGFVTKISRVNIYIDCSYMNCDCVNLKIRKETIIEFIKA